MAVTRMGSVSASMAIQFQLSASRLRRNRLSLAPTVTVLAANQGLSLVECELITGRTHQIRAQFAHAGHPLLGDGKYGKLDKRFDRNYQALYSYKLTFTFTTDAGALEHLNGRSFQVETVDFVEEYFPNVK